MAAVSPSKKKKKPPKDVPLTAALAIREHVSEEDVASSPEVILQILPADVATEALNDEAELTARNASSAIAALAIATITTTATASHLNLDASTYARQSR